MELATYLRSQRERKGVSQTSWAALSGISRMTLWRWERATCLPHEIEFHQALKALAVTREEYLHAIALRDQAWRRRRAARRDEEGVVAR